MSESPKETAAADDPHVSVVLEGEAFQHTEEAWRETIQAVIREQEPWALVGIKRRGAILARRLWESFRGEFPQLLRGEVDISLYRDDYHLKHSQPRVLGTEIDFQVDGCHILLVDDVLFSGRTVRAAIDQILDFGRPRRVLLAVFVDRGHRELPIASDFTAMEMRTVPQDRVQVRLRELDGADRIVLVSGGMTAK